MVAHDSNPSIWEVKVERPRPFILTIPGSGRQTQDDPRGLLPSQHSLTSEFRFPVEDLYLKKSWWP